MASQPNQPKQDPNQDPEQDSKLLQTVGQLFNLTVFLSFFVVALLAYVVVFTQPKSWMTAWWVRVTAPEQEATVTEATPAAPAVAYWTAPSTSSISDPEQKKQIEYGKDLIAHTAKYFGPEGIIEKNRTNGLNCQNCHLDAGTKIFGNNYSAVASNYPKFRARSGQVENIFKRVNDCFERSMNGSPLPLDSADMTAILAYMTWLSQGVPVGLSVQGRGFPHLDAPPPPDPAHGRVLYAERCVACHGADGQGVSGPDGEPVFPPLWGGSVLQHQRGHGPPEHGCCLCSLEYAPGPGGQPERSGRPGSGRILHGAAAARLRPEGRGLGPWRQARGRPLLMAFDADELRSAGLIEGPLGGPMRPTAAGSGPILG